MNAARDRMVIGCALAVVAVTLSIVPTLQLRLNTMRTDLGLMARERPEDMPPEYALMTIGLGSFRGLATNILWARAHALEQRGRYHEASKLAEVISLMQPNYPQVWSFRAWNLAFNISVASHTPEERWKWVNDGVRMLRDKAIPRNPRSLLLYMDLARLYLYKIGDADDTHHWFYKQQLALRWHTILGPPPTGDREVVAAWLQPIVDAPDEERDLVADETVAAQLDALRSIGFVADIGLLRGLNAIDARKQSAALGLLLDDSTTARRLERLRTWRDAEEGAEARAAIVAYTRRKLVRELKLDPVEMQRLVKAHGPLDWRHPAAHGIYWCEQGHKLVEADAEAVRRENTDFWNVYRFLLKAGQHLTLRGEITFDPATGRFGTPLPNPRFVSFYDKCVTLAIANVPDDRPGVKERFRDGRRNFLLWAASVTHYYGDEQTAQQIYMGLQDENPDDPNFKPTWRQKLDDLERILPAKGLLTPEQIEQKITGLYNKAIQRGLAHDQKDAYARMVSTAGRIHRANKRLMTLNGLDTSELREPAVLLKDTYAHYMTRPPDNATLLQRAKIWRITPQHLRLAVYKAIIPILREECKRNGQIDPDRAFPSPFGSDDDD